MRTVPGVTFVDGATGRRAVIAGTGHDVWEIVSAWKSVGREFSGLDACYPWLSELQLKSALGYFQVYPDEIEARLRLEAEWTPERTWDELPFARPRSPND